MGVQEEISIQPNQSGPVHSKRRKFNWGLTSCTPQNLIIFPRYSGSTDKNKLQKGTIIYWQDSTIEQQ